MARVRKQYRSNELSRYLDNVRKKLRLFSEENRLSQRAVAGKAGITLSTVNEIWTGAARDVRLSTLVALASALDRDVLQLMAGSDLSLTDPDKQDLETVWQRINRLYQKHCG
jgi:transcriptional regulator with XRE-family HTH domain